MTSIFLDPHFIPKENDGKCKQRKGKHGKGQTRATLESALTKPKFRELHFSKCINYAKSKMWKVIFASYENWSLLPVCIATSELNVASSNRKNVDSNDKISYYSEHSGDINMFPIHVPFSCS